jgi:Zn-dependent protease with chaperone function
LIALLGFVLECVAAAALVGTATSIAMFAAAVPLARGGRLVPPGLRADLLLLAGIVPALAGLTVMSAAAAPSIGSFLGLAPDHCPGHADHFHICFVHSPELRPALAVVGAFALVVWLCRAGGLLRASLRSASQARSLEKLGKRRDGAFPIYVLPGAKLCHATGLWRRRIMLSEDVASALDGRELESALSHEESHLRRRDPLSSLLLSVAGLFVPASIARRMRHWHREAAEQACDAAAAAKMGGGMIVASALLKVAALQKGLRGAAGAQGWASAFGDHALENRVRALLAIDRFTPTESRWRSLLAIAVASFLVLGLAEAEALHHGIEHLLGDIFF